MTFGAVTPGMGTAGSNGTTPHAPRHDSGDEPAVELAGVTKVHGTGHVAVTALQPTDLSVYPGELVAIMGPSGSGKSTLLSLAGGLERPTGGRIRTGGVELTELDANGIAAIRRRIVGYIFQDLNLLSSLTAVENVSLPLELDGVAPDEAHREASDALAAVHMIDLAERYPDDLSGGEQQRVAIARAIVGERRILLADEPTGALDTVNGEDVMRLLRDRCDRGACGVLVTHDAAHAAWADRVVFLRDGRIVDESVSASRADISASALVLPETAGQAATVGRP